MTKIERIPQYMIGIKREINEPQWNREITHVNLPDAQIGLI